MDVAFNRDFMGLLIVPYGIETALRRSCVHSSILLIVPYGIETKYLLYGRYSDDLLIVPYGIETPDRNDS